MRQPCAPLARVTASIAGPPPQGGAEYATGGGGDGGHVGCQICIGCVASHCSSTISIWLLTVRHKLVLPETSWPSAFRLYCSGPPGEAVQGYWTRTVPAVLYWNPPAVMHQLRQGEADVSEESGTRRRAMRTKQKHHSALKDDGCL